MVPSLRIETDPFTATLRQEPRTGAPQERGDQGFSNFLSAARPVEAPRKAAPTEEPAPTERNPPAEAKAEAPPEPKPEPTKLSLPESRPKAEEADNAPDQAEPKPEPEPLSPQPVLLGLEAALVPALPKLPPAGIVPPEALSSLTDPGIAPSAPVLVAVPSVAATPVPQPIPFVADQTTKEPFALPAVDGEAAPSAKPLDRSLLPPESLQVEAPATTTKAATLIPLAKAFMVSEQFSAESPTVAFTLPAENHPLVREMMAQIRPEPEVLKLSARVSAEPSFQPETKAMVKPTPEAQPKAEARPEEAATSASSSTREAQAPKPHSPEGALSPTALRIAAANPNLEGLPTPTVAQSVGTPAAPTATLAAPAVVATAPHPAAVQVEGGIRWLLTKERSGAELQLHPESLGRITIQLRVDQGEVHARVWATEPSTLPLLQDHKAFLEVSLRQQGLSLGSFDLQQGQRGGQPQADPGSWQGNGRSVSGIAGLGSGQDSPAVVSAPSAYRGLIEVFA